MGSIYKARHEHLGDIRALKHLRPELVVSPHIIERFKAEAQTLFKLEHPNIVKVYDIFSVNSNWFICMEFIQGQSLADILKTKKRENKLIEVNLVLEYIKQILDALAYAHENDVIHRDIKPSNILLSAENKIKVVDFGIVKIRNRHGMTNTGATIGSPYYMSPEQILGLDLDERSDIFSLGITMFELLSGDVPFSNTTEFKIYQMIQKAPLPQLKNVNPDLKDGLENILRKATEKDREDRYSNAREFSEDIGQFMELNRELLFPDNEHNDTIQIDINSIREELDHESRQTQTNTQTSNSVFIKIPPSAEKTNYDDPDSPQSPFDKTVQGQTSESITSHTINDTIVETSSKIASVQQNHIESQKPNTYQRFIKPYAQYIYPGIIGLFLLILYFSISADMSKIIIRIDEEKSTSLKLSWQPAQQDDYDSWMEIKQFVISRNGRNIQNTGQKEFVDETVEPGSNYHYTISAKDGDSDDIAYGEISVSVPAIDFGLKKEIIKNKVRIEWNHIDGVQSYSLVQDGYNNPIYNGNSTSFIKRYDEGTYYISLSVHFLNGKVYTSQPLPIEIEGRKTGTPAVTHRPVIAAIPNQTIHNSDNFRDINLDDYVKDLDNTDSEIRWTFQGNKNINLELTQNRILKIKPNSKDWDGSETITFIARDPAGHNGKKSVVFTKLKKITPKTSLITQAEGAFKKGDLRLAISIASEITKPANRSDQRQDYLEGLILRARSYVRLKDDREAINLYNEALDIQTHNRPDLHLELASLYSRSFKSSLDELKKAVVHFEKAILDRNAFENKESFFMTRYKYIKCLYFLAQKEVNPKQREEFRLSAEMKSREFIAVYDHNPDQYVHFSTPYNEVKNIYNNVIQM